MILDMAVFASPALIFGVVNNMTTAARMFKAEQERQRQAEQASQQAAERELSRRRQAEIERRRQPKRERSNDGTELER